jgi:sister-chromatid-cohesion protein PDS5
VAFLDMLHSLIDELDSLTTDVIETVLLQFMKRTRDASPAAHALAVALCNAAADKLQRYICQYFSDAIIMASKEEGGEDDLRTAHFLIWELYKAAPKVLLNVIPQLEEELKVRFPRPRKPPARIARARVAAKMLILQICAI